MVIANCYNNIDFRSITCIKSRIRCCTIYIYDFLVIDKFVKVKFEKDGDLYLTKYTNNSTLKVAEFYKDKPFPDYKNGETKQSLLEIGDKNLVSKYIKNFIGYNKNILEVGSGTSQLSLYLAIGNNNNIYALDPTYNSLKIGSEFAKNNKIKNIKFVQGDIFDDIFYENKFDFVWCSGVLHHTENPELAFKILCRYLKKDGYLLLGLYNKYGRKILELRRYLSKIFGEKIIDLIDPVAKKLKKNHQKRKYDSWINDQYFHPIESTHTFKEILKWFDNNNIEFISSIPSTDYLNNYDNLIEKKSRPDDLNSIFLQINMNFNEFGEEGGLFMFIGRKK